MIEERITLFKSREEIICRLTSVDDDVHYIQYLYPAIATAITVKNGAIHTKQALESTIAQVIHNYVILTGFTGELATVVEDEAHTNCADWIDALVCDNTVIRSNQIYLGSD